MNTGGYRLPELDSIRGIAALVVVFHHFLYMWFLNKTKVVSPEMELLYPFVAGHESVVLFFLLSGFVLAQRYLRGKPQRYRVYLLRRVVRIYCPYLFALGLAVGGNAVWHGRLGLGWWADKTWYAPVSWLQVLRNMCMLGSPEIARYGTAFWSLNHEMRISVLFPPLVLLIRKMKTRTALIMAAALSLPGIVTGEMRPFFSEAGTTLAYTGVFVCGILLAMHMHELGPWYRSLRGSWRIAFALGAVSLYDYSQVLLHGPWPGVWRIEFLADWPVVAGAAGLLLLSIESSAARAVLNSPIPRFLGRISYSLYLVHATVLFALTFALHGKVSPGAVFCLYVPAALLISTAFCYIVEEPFIRLSRRLGERSPRSQGRLTSERIPQAEITPAYSPLT